MAANSGYPLSLDVKGYPVLVLGETRRLRKRRNSYWRQGRK